MGLAQGQLYIAAWSSAHMIVSAEHLTNGHCPFSCALHIQYWSNEHCPLSCTLHYTMLIQWVLPILLCSALYNAEPIGTAYSPVLCTVQSQQLHSSFSRQFPQQHLCAYKHCSSPGYLQGAFSLTSQPFEDPAPCHGLSCSPAPLHLTVISACSAEAEATQTRKH